MLGLLLNQLKEKQRSTFWQKSLVVNILLGIFGLYFLVNIAVVGFFADTIITRFYPDRNIIEAFISLFFYYLVIDLNLRFIFNPIPALSVQPYLVLPIKKNNLLHYPLIMSALSFYNLIPLLLILPFFVKVVCISYPFFFCFNWIIGIISMVIVNTFISFCLKKSFLNRPVLILLIFLACGGILYFDIRSSSFISGYFSSAFLFMSWRPFLMVVPIILAILSYITGYSILKNGAYLEDSRSIHTRNIKGFQFMTNYGETGNLLMTEIKLILRNKRPKSLLIFSLLIYAYGFFIYNHPRSNENLPFLIIIGFLLSTAFAITYGQYMYSWEGCFFDCYLVNKISVTNYLTSKFLLFAIAGFIGFIPTLAFGIFSYKIVVANALMMLYNIGITSFLLIFLCTFNTTKIDLGKSQFMNYQGMGLLQLLLILPLFGIPLILFLLIELLNISKYGLYIFGMVGVTGIIFHKYILRLIAYQFLRRKYKMAYGFRQD